MTERKLDIFRVLKQADLKNAEFFEKLTDEERKAFQPFLVTRWLSGTYSARQVYFLNEIVNPLAFSLANHKQLLWQLMTICTSGKSQRYIWNKLPARTSSAKPTSAKAISEYYGYSTRDASDALDCLDGNDVLDIAEAVGMQAEDLSKIRKEYKDEQLRADDIGFTKTKSKNKPQQEKIRDFFEF